jgi:hypothetical protein
VTNSYGLGWGLYQMRLFMLPSAHYKDIAIRIAFSRDIVSGKFSSGA